MIPDLVSDVLRRVRLRGSLYFHVRCSREWVAEAPPAREIAAAVMRGAEHVMEFHLVLSGTCWAGAVGGTPVRLAAGDLAVFVRGDPHVVSSGPGMRAPPDVQGYFDRQHQPGPFRLRLDSAVPAPDPGPEGVGDTTLVCGFLGCDLQPFNPLIAALPSMLHLPAAADADWALQCMRQAVRESDAAQAGSGAMLERLSEMLFIDAVRRYLATLPADSRGWLGALRDRCVGHALALLHETPAARWTVDELGHRVGLSRSALHERFAALVGETPMQYLAHWRMQVGASLLRDTPASIVDIALQTGYESEAAFGRAFKRLTGQTPAAWRRQVRG